MIITHKAITRRTVLRAAGAAVALPLLDAMVPALSAAAKAITQPTRRLGFVYFPNGSVMSQWTPAREGALELASIHQSLAAFRDRLVVVSNLAARAVEPEVGETLGGGEHARASAAWLSGVHVYRSAGPEVRGGKTADQVAADQLGGDTPLRSLELATEDFGQAGACDAGFACTYQNTLSWRTGTTPLPMQTNPRTVFEQLFGDRGPNDDRQRRTEEDRSLLDAIVGEVARLRKRVGSDDRHRIEQYLDAVREIEHRIKKLDEHGDNVLDLPHQPAGVPEVYDEYVKLMFDLQTLAYQADITRVGTFMLAREASQRTYDHIGVADPHHALSHHGYVPAKVAQLAKVCTHHADLFGYYLEKLAATPDGDGSLLDHSLILYGGCLSDGHMHTSTALPLLLAGGAGGHLTGGRHLSYPARTPMTNLLVSMLDKVGVEVEKIADSTGALPGL